MTDWAKAASAAARQTPDAFVEAMRTMTISTEAFMEWLGGEVVRADERRMESSGIAINSYGAGYDQGRLDGLREALAKWSEIEPAAHGEGGNKNG